MDKIAEKKKSGLAAIFLICPVRHVIVLLCGIVIVLHLLLRRLPGVNGAYCRNFVRPAHMALSRFTALFPFSVAELLIAALVVYLLGYTVFAAYRLVRYPGRGRRIYISLVTFAAAGLGFYASFCLLWGSYFYADSFAAANGLDAGPVSVEQLRAVTEYFAELTNEYAVQVPRDESGVCATDKGSVLARSPEVYANAAERFPTLRWPEVPAKGVFFSRIMSWLDFTGFFFALTGEANVNTDFPPSLFASTVAHELAHQRGVAREQEANFVAVMASLDYGDEEYCYSACLLAYIHLGNALYEADRPAWEQVYGSLSEPVLRDLAANRAYWDKFDTPVQTVSNTVYENFMYSYNQDMGLKSYGACVDLLVHYFYDRAAG